MMKKWHKAEKGGVHAVVIPHVTRIESNQAEMFDRFVKLAALYNPNTDATNERAAVNALGGVTENVVASNVDTVTAAIAATDVRARFQTDDGDWSTQRRATHMEWYAEGLATLLDVTTKCRRGFKGSAIKGTGVNRVRFDKRSRSKIHVEPIPIDNIIVDETLLKGGNVLREMHQRTPNVVAEDLIAMHPKHATAIERCAGSGSKNRTWAGYRPIADDTLVVVESWRLPVGTPGEDGYIPGRYVKCIEGADLVDEEWDEDFFPFAVMRWSDEEDCFYGIGGVERIAGHQRVMNKSNWQIDRLIDQYAVPTTYVQLADANLAVKSTNRLGTIAVYKQAIPQTVHPPAVSPEVYQRRTTTRDSAFEEFGVSRLAAQSAKPAGLDSGVALREYRDQTTQRFSLQEKAFERFVLDTIVLVMWAAKKLGKDAPVMMRRTKFGARRIKWSDVEIRDVKVQIAAASTVARTPAGRMQSVIEWAQAGIITQDEARRLLGHPDLDSAMSLYTAARETFEHAWEEIRDGKIVMPEPFMNLAMCVHYGQANYLKDRDNGAPEEILEAGRQFIVQAAWMLSQANQPAQNANAMPGDPAAMPAGPPAPGDVVDPMAAPTGGPAMAAFSPQAMQLRAGV